MRANIARDRARARRRRRRARSCPCARMPVEERARVALQQRVEAEPHLATQPRIEPAREPEVDEQHARARGGRGLVDHEQIARDAGRRGRGRRRRPASRRRAPGSRAPRAARPAGARAPRGRRCGRRAGSSSSARAASCGSRTTRGTTMRGSCARFAAISARDARLALEVELLARGPRANSAKQARAIDGARRAAREQRAAARATSARSARSEPREPRVLHLHRDRLAAGQARAVHLRDRRGAERRRLELREAARRAARRARLSTAACTCAKASGGTRRAAPRTACVTAAGSRSWRMRGELARLREGALAARRAPRPGALRARASKPPAAARARSRSRRRRARAAPARRRGSRARRQQAQGGLDAARGAARSAGPPCAPRGGSAALANRALDGANAVPARCMKCLSSTPRESVVYSSASASERRSRTRSPSTQEPSR